MKIYLVTTINVEAIELCTYENKIFLNKEIALEYYNNKINKWKESYRSHNKEYTNEEFEDIITEALVEEITTSKKQSNHYAYDCEKEAIFELEEKEICIDLPKKRGEYVCIKECGCIKEGMECNVIDQDQHTITVQYIYNPFSTIEFISYEEFMNSFKRREINECKRIKNIIR